MKPDQELVRLREVRSRVIQPQGSQIKGRFRGSGVQIKSQSDSGEPDQDSVRFREARLAADLGESDQESVSHREARSRVSQTQGRQIKSQSASEKPDQESVRQIKSQSPGEEVD